MTEDKPPSESETWPEQVYRLQAMSEDERGLTWDLSENDRAAIKAALLALAEAGKLEER